jgi:hypothetical protein
MSSMKYYMIQGKVSSRNMKKWNMVVISMEDNLHNNSIKHQQQQQQQHLLNYRLETRSTLFFHPTECTHVSSSILTSPEEDEDTEENILEDDEEEYHPITSLADLVADCRRRVEQTPRGVQPLVQQVARGMLNTTNSTTPACRIIRASDLLNAATDDRTNNNTDTTSTNHPRPNATGDGSIGRTREFHCGFDR